MSSLLLAVLADEVVFARRLVGQLHRARFLEPGEAVGNRPRGSFDPAADRAGGDGLLAPVLFHVAEHEAVQRTGAQPLAAVLVGGLRAGRFRFRRGAFRFGTRFAGFTPAARAGPAGLAFVAVVLIAIS